MHQVVVSHEAENVLDRLDRPTEHRIRQRPPKSRAGGWRTLYPVDRTTKKHRVLDIDARGQVYRH